MNQRSPVDLRSCFFVFLYYVFHQLGPRHIASLYLEAMKFWGSKDFWEQRRGAAIPTASSRMFGSVAISNVVCSTIYLLSNIFARDSIYAIARICDRNSVRTSGRPDVRHTGGLSKNG